jgi:hypothetical protein
MDQRLYIALLGFLSSRSRKAVGLQWNPMMECQLHCLDGFRFLMKPEAQQTDDSLFGPFLSRVGPAAALRALCSSGEAVARTKDVQRFERQGYAGNGVST